MTNKMDMILSLLLLAVVAAIGVAVARTLVHRYELLVNASLGFAVLYFAYRLYLSPKRNVSDPLSVRIGFPKLVGVMVGEFLLTMVVYWAGRYLLDAAVVLMSVFTNR